MRFGTVRPSAAGAYSRKMPTARRERIGLTAAVAVLVASIAAAPVFGPLATVPPGLAVACMFIVIAQWRPAWRPALAGAAGVGSLLATAGALMTGRTFDVGQSVTAWMLAESAALLVLVVLVVRSEPVRRAAVAGGLAGVAVPLWLLRFGTPDPVLLAGVAAWSVPALLAAAFGIYLRWLDARRTRSVAEARRRQRLRLARDLHDFVAHDVSEILALAQAGQVASSGGSTNAADIFGRIEQAGQHAMASLDRTVRMLHDHAPTATASATLSDLPDLATRFSASGNARVELDIDPRLARSVPGEVARTAYRVVTEALTNVRRHAPAAGHVTVSVRGVDHALEVVVTNDGTGTTRRSNDRGGRGLPGLNEQVDALGGTLTAGPYRDHQWRVTTTLPMT